MSDSVEPDALSAGRAPRPVLPAVRRWATPRLRRGRSGAAHVLGAARLLARDRGLLRAAVVPTLLTLLGSVVVALCVVLTREEPGHPWRTFALAFVAVSSLPPTLLQRAWVRVGLEARRALGASPGAPEHPERGFVALALSEAWKAALQALAVTLGLAPLYLVLVVLPGHHVTVATVGVIWTGYWLLLDAIELPVELEPGKLGPGAPTWFERLLRRVARVWGFCFFRWGARFLGWCARPWRHPAKLTERFPWECLGFGLGSLALLAVPVVNAFFRAVVITAATSLVVDLRAPIAGAPPVPAAEAAPRPPAA